MPPESASSAYFTLSYVGRQSFLYATGVGITKCVIHFVAADAAIDNTGLCANKGHWGDVTFGLRLMIAMIGWARPVYKFPVEYVRSYAAGHAAFRLDLRATRRSDFAFAGYSLPRSLMYVARRRPRLGASQSPARQCHGRSRLQLTPRHYPYSRYQAASPQPLVLNEPHAFRAKVIIYTIILFH